MSRSASDAVLRAMFIIANPSDRPRFDDVRLWESTSEVLAPFARRGWLSFERGAQEKEAQSLVL